MYENDEFRESSFGHICNRDSLLFLWESLLEDEDEEEEKKEEPPAYQEPANLPMTPARTYSDVIRGTGIAMKATPRGAAAQA